MSLNNIKTSLLVPSQLPEFIRDNPDYDKFVTFLQAYYEWMEEQGGVLDSTKNLLSYSDIDSTTDGFLQYFINDFLPYWPENALLNKKSAIKYARELYSTKGTPASYQFLFKILYDSEFDVEYTKDSVLKASAGTWYVAKSLKLASSDDRLLSIDNMRLFGETTKSIATVEASVKAGTKTEVFISNIERLFQSGEMVRVVDGNNQTILYDGLPLRAKVVGQLSQIKIDPKNRGLLYEVGDPVIVYGGLSSANGHGAIAEVSATTKGSVQRVNVVTGGYGYRPDPNTAISFSNLGIGAVSPIAIVGSVDPTSGLTANVNFIPQDTITLKRFIDIGNSNYFFSNIAISNVNTTLANAFTFTSFETYPISSILVENGGGGITKSPVAAADSIYQSDLPTVVGHIKNLGILAPIQVVDGGVGYEVNDTITLVGGSGYGAYANVQSINATGSIATVGYIQGVNPYPLGGMGYGATGLPLATVESANVSAYGSILSVPGILGDGATFSVVVDRAGSITTIALTDPGEDYISTANVSIKIQDIVVSNVFVTNLPSRDQTVYQTLTNENNSTYLSFVDSVELLTADADPAKSLYNLRVYNYNSKPNPNLELHFEESDDFIHGGDEDESYHPVFIMANTAYTDPTHINPDGSSVYDVTGVRTYGDGTAKATASFLNGLVISQGQYLDSSGQPSGFNVLQSDIYNNYTYIITVEKEIAKYRDILLNLLHPSGTRLLGRYAVKTDAAFNFKVTDALVVGHTLDYLANTNASVSIITDFTNKSNNIIQFNDLAGANVAEFISVGDSVAITSDTNDTEIDAVVLSVDFISNTVTVDTNTWLTFANVAYITANSGSNNINIISLTGAYDIMNGGNYSNTAYPLKDIVYAGDKVLVANNSEATVESVDYINGRITLTSNLSANANSLMDVNRTFNTNQVNIFGALGTQYGE